MVASAQQQLDRQLVHNAYFDVARALAARFVGLDAGPEYDDALDYLTSRPLTITGYLDADVGPAFADAPQAIRQLQAPEEPEIPRGVNESAAALLESVLEVRYREAWYEACESMALRHVYGKSISLDAARQNIDTEEVQIVLDWLTVEQRGFDATGDLESDYVAAFKLCPQFIAKLACPVEPAIEGGADLDEAAARLVTALVG